MKEPIKKIPTEIEILSGNKPQIPITESSGISIENDSLAPTQSPPDIEAELAFDAAVWSNNKRVNGLYTTFNARNAWMSIVGVGWVKLAIAKDSACEAMNILASHARMKNSRIDYSIDGGVVDQMYIW